MSSIQPGFLLIFLGEDNLFPLLLSENGYLCQHLTSLLLQEPAVIQSVMSDYRHRHKKGLEPSRAAMYSMRI